MSHRRGPVVNLSHLHNRASVVPRVLSRSEDSSRPKKYVSALVSPLAPRANANAAEIKDSEAGPVRVSERASERAYIGTCHYHSSINLNNSHSAARVSRKAASAVSQSRFSSANIVARRKFGKRRFWRFYLLFSVALYSYSYS